MISLEKLTHKLGQLDESIAILKGMEQTPIEAFLKDKILIGAAKYYLQISIECCLDIANHIIASESYRAPTDYADAFKVLEENNIITQEFSLRLRQMAKFRNRLVHLYGEIDNTYVLGIIKNDMDDLNRFKSAIISKYIK